jgi:hypothetical protein
MAYEISSSVAASTFSTQAVTSSVTNGFEQGGKFSPDGTKLAVSTYRHGGAGSTDYGIDIYTSSSASGWARTESIDATTAPGHLEWFSDNNIFSIQGSYVRNYVSSSASGWAAGQVIVANGGDYYMEFNPSKTILATWSGTNQYYRSIYSGSGNWTSTADLKGGNYGDLESLAWISDDTIALGYPENSSYRGILLTYKTTNGGSSYSMSEYLNGDSSWLPGMGASLYYHTASNSLLVGTRDGTNEGAHADNKLILFQSSSAAGVLPSSYTSHTVIDSGKRVYLGHHTAIQHGNGDRVLMVTHDAIVESSTANADLVAIESGSAGWKVTVIDADIRQPGTDGNIDISSAGAVVSNDTTVGTGQATFLVRQMIAGNPALATSVTSSIGSSGGTLSAGGTQASPKISVTVPSNALSGDTSLSAEVMSNAGYKTSNLSSIKSVAGSAGAEMVGDIIRLTPHGQQFSQAVTVQFVLDSAPSDLTIWKRDHHESGYTQWYQLPAGLWSNSGTTVTISTTRFSEYAGIGGLNVARTKLNNSQLVTLTAADLVDSTSIRVSGSNTFKNLTVAAADLFVIEQGGGTYHVSASQMAEYFGGLVNVTASAQNVDMKITMVTPSDTTDVGLEVDAGLLYNPWTNKLTVSGDASIGDDLFLASDAAVLNFGADSDVSLTHVADTALLLNSSRQLQFGDSGTYIHQSADGVLDLVSDTEIEINATTIDINGAIDASSTITAAGRVIVDDATDASSTTDGSLQTDGGLSVAKDVVAGNDVKLLSDAAVLNFGADSDVSVTHVADTGLLLNSTRQLQFGDSGTYIHQSADGVLDLVSDTEIEINATTIDINGAIDASNNLTVGELFVVNASNKSSATDNAMLVEGTSQIRLTANETFKVTNAANASHLTVLESGDVEFDSYMVYDKSDADLKFKDPQSSSTTTIILNDGYNGGIISGSGELLIGGTISGKTSLKLDATTISTAELAVLDGATSDSQASKVIVTDGSGDFEMQDSDKIFFGTGADVSIHWDGSAMKIGTDTSGAPITIGNGTSEVTVADNLTVAGNHTITGNLTVNGATTTISTANLQVEDSLVELSDGASGTPANDQGFIFNRGSSDNAALIWDESSDMFKFANVGSASADSTGNLAHASTMPLSASLFYGDGSNLTGVGAEVLAAVDGNSADLKLTFVSGAASAATFYIDSGLVFNPNTNLLTTPGNIALPDGANIGNASDPNALTIGTGGITVTATSDASSTSSGALIVGGGAGIAAKLFVGGDTSIAGATTITSTTESTTTGTGALIVYGGVGIGGDANFADDVTLKSDSGSLGWGQDSEVTLTHVHNTGLILNSSRQLQFGDSGTYIHQSADGVLDLVSDTEIELTATTIDINGAVDASSTITAAGRIIVDDATEATSTTDGSLQTDGGLSVAKSAVIGDDLDLLSDGAILNFGADKDVVLTHVADTGLLLNSTRQLQFGDSGTYIHQSADGVLDLVSDTEIEINATAVDINGAVDISSTLTVNTVADLAADSNDATHHFLIMDSDDSIVKKESMSDMATEFADAAGTKGGIQVHQGKFYVAPVEDSFMSSSNNTSMSGSRPSDGGAGASGLCVTASLSVTCLSGSLMVFLNGLLQTRSGSANLTAGADSIWDYKLDSYTAPTKVVMSDALDDDDVLIVRYIQK